MEEDVSLGGASARLRAQHCHGRHPHVNLRLLVKGLAIHVLEAEVRSDDVTRIDRMRTLLLSTRLCSASDACAAESCRHDAEEPPLLTSGIP